MISVFAKKPNKKKNHFISIPSGRGWFAGRNQELISSSGSRNLTFSIPPKSLIVSGVDLAQDLMVTIRQSARISAGGHAATLTIADLNAPTVPTGLIAIAISSTVISVSWNASTDNSGLVQSGVANYVLRRNGSVIATQPTLTFSDTGKAPSTQYSYTIQAVDAAGNASAQSVSESATTPSSGGGNPSSTYTATHFVAPFASVSGAANDYTDLGSAAFNAASSSSTPTTAGTAFRWAVAGNKVKFAPGLYTGVVAQGISHLAAFSPTNSSTAVNQIVFFAEYPAAYNTNNPELLTQLHRVWTVGQNTCLGVKNGSSDPGKDYIIFDGPYFDEFITRSGPNTGICTLRGSTGGELRRIWINRSNVPPYGGGFNGAPLYMEVGDQIKVRDSLFTGTSTLTTNQDACIETYNINGVEFLNCDFRQAGIAVHIKTEARTAGGPAFPMDNAVVRFCKMVGFGGVVHQTGRGIEIDRSLIVATDGGGVRWTNYVDTALEDDPTFATTFVIKNCTVLRNGAVGNAALSLQGKHLVDAGTQWYNNIFRDTSGNSTNTVDLPGSTTWTADTLADFDLFDYNFYQTSTPRFRLHNNVSLATHTSFAAYQSALAALGHEQNSQIGTVTFVDEAGGNYRLAANGQAALTAGNTGGPVGCYITGTEEIGLRANPTY